MEVKSEEQMRTIKKGKVGGERQGREEISDCCSMRATD